MAPQAKGSAGYWIQLSLSRVQVDIDYRDQYGSQTDTIHSPHSRSSLTTMAPKKLITFVVQYQPKNNGPITDEMRQIMADCTKKVAEHEPDNLYFGFQTSGNQVSVREGFLNLEAVNKHMENCGPLIGKFLEHCDMKSFTVHGPKDMCDKLEPGLKPYNATFWHQEGPLHMK